MRHSNPGKDSTDSNANACIEVENVRAHLHTKEVVIVVCHCCSWVSETLCACSSSCLLLSPGAPKLTTSIGCAHLHV